LGHLSISLPKLRSGREQHVFVKPFDVSPIREVARLGISVGIP